MPCRWIYLPCRPKLGSGNLRRRVPRLVPVRLAMGQTHSEAREIPDTTSLSIEFPVLQLECQHSLVGDSIGSYPQARLLPRFTRLGHPEPGSFFINCCTGRGLRQSDALVPISGGGSQIAARINKCKLSLETRPSPGTAFQSPRLVCPPSGIRLLLRNAEDAAPLNSVLTDFWEKNSETLKITRSCSRPGVESTTCDWQ